MELLSHRRDDDVGEVESFYLAVTVTTVLVVLTVGFSFGVSVNEVAGHTIPCLCREEQC